MLTQRPLAAGSSDEGGTWQMAVALASWRPVHRDDCLYIGFHLCIGLIFIFLRCPDAVVIDWLETTHLSGFRGGRRFPSRVQWSLKCLIRCRGISAWVPLCRPPPLPQVDAITQFGEDLRFFWAWPPLLSFSLDATLIASFSKLLFFSPPVVLVLETAFMWLLEFAELIRVGNLVVKQVQTRPYEIM